MEIGRTESVRTVLFAADVRAVREREDPRTRVVRGIEREIPVPDPEGRKRPEEVQVVAQVMPDHAFVGRAHHLDIDGLPCSGLDFDLSRLARFVGGRRS